MEENATILPSKAPNFSKKHRIIRLLWGAIWLVCASWTPRQFAPWRRFLLRRFGATLTSTSDVRGSARVWYPVNLTMERACILADGVNCYNMAPILIRENSIISQGAYLCGGTHDYTKGKHPLITRPIVIGPHAWVAAEAFIGPGAVVSEGCVIGARAVVSGQTDPWSVYAGNPATRIKERIFDQSA